MLFVVPCFLLGAVTALPHPQDEALEVLEQLGGGPAGVVGALKIAQDLQEGAADSWESDEAGANTIIEVSQTRVAWGDQKPWELVEAALSKCHSNKCPPKVEQTEKIIIIENEKGENAEITVRVEGTFEKGNDEADLTTLTDLAALAFKEFSAIEERTARGVNSCTWNGQCKEIGGTTNVQYHTVSAVTITVHDKERGLEGSLGVSVEVNRGLVSEECMDIAGTASTISGELSGWSTPLSLLSLICSAL